MARYWIGGNGSWNDTAHWSTSSSGVGGASVPTSSDDVFFDSGSWSGVGVGTISWIGTVSCRNFNYQVPSPGGTQGIQFVGTAFVGELDVYGSFFSSSPNFGADIYVTLVFKATTTGQTITQGSSLLGLNHLNDVIFDGVGGEWTIQDTLDVGKGLEIRNGSFVSNGAPINCNRGFNSNNSNIRSISLGSSTITVGLTWDISTSTNITFNAGTSTISMGTSSSGVTNNFHGGGLTYYDMSIAASATVINLVMNIYGSNSWHNFVVFNTGGVIQLNFEAGTTQTMSGNFNVNTANIRSLTDGVTAYISAVSATILAVDVKDNHALGVGVPFVDLISVGGVDSGNNYNWLFIPLVLTSSSPSHGTVGTTITLSGTGFVQSGSTLTVRIGGVTVGTANITVNGSGTVATFLAPVHTVGLVNVNALIYSYTSATKQFTYDPTDFFLQNVQLVGSDTAGDIQTFNAGKSDDGDPIYYELTTQDQDFGNRNHLKVISDKIAAFTKFGGDSTIEISSNTEVEEVDINLAGRVNISKDINIEGNYFNIKWYGESETESPVLEGFYIETVTDKGTTYE